MAFIIGWLAILPVMRLYTEWVQSFLPAALAGPLQDGSLPSVLQKLPTNIISWVGINLMFFYVLGLDRFGYFPPGRHAPAPFGQADPDPGSIPTAQEATAAGTIPGDADTPAMADALAELCDSEGMRVHRSWWVAERAVEGEEKGEKLVLVNGMKVPVSRSYRMQARDRGWLG